MGWYLPFYNPTIFNKFNNHIQIHTSVHLPATWWHEKYLDENQFKINTIYVNWGKKVGGNLLHYGTLKLNISKKIDMTLGLINTILSTTENSYSTAPA